MAVEYVELMPECCTQHLSMKTIRLKWDNEGEEEGKQKKSENGKLQSGHEEKKVRTD